MLTLGSLIATDRQLDAVHVADSTRPVLGMWTEGDTPRRRGWRDMLAVVTRPERWSTPALCAERASVLASSGAVGIVVVKPAPGPLRAAAEQAGLTLLVAPEAVYLLRLAQEISDQRQEQEAAHSRQMRVLIERARNPSSEYSTPEGICLWLAEAVRGYAALAMPFDVGSFALPGGIDIPPDVLESVIDGSRQTVALSEGNWLVRLYALGSAAPRPVLAVARQGTWDERSLAAIEQTHAVLAWWVSLTSADTEAMTQVRGSLMQMVMAGHLQAAQRAAMPLQISSAVMHAEQVVVYICQGSVASRTSIAEACVAGLGSRALVAPCPVDPRQVVVMAGDEDGPGETLKAIAALYGGYVGASRPVAPHSAAEGHEQATRALAAAADSAGRLAVFAPDAPVISLFARDPAHRWAASLLTPLEDWDADRRDRDNWLATIRQWMALGATGTACLTGLHRNTVERRVSAIGAMLDIDITQLVDRLKLDLALRIMDLHGGRAPVEGPVPTCEELLEAPDLSRWAEEYLAPLRGDLRETLAVWVDVNQSAALTAARLGIGQKAVRARLRRASAALQQPLIPHSASSGRRDSINGFTGAHDVALALMIARWDRFQSGE